MLYIYWLILAILVGILGKNRKIGFGWALFWAIILSPVIGLIIVLCSTPKQKVEHKYKEYLELGKKSEYKKKYALALDNYQDALYHLENDYSNLKKQSEIMRQQRIQETKEKIISMKDILKNEKFSQEL